MWTPGLGELVIILIIVLALFGGGKIAGVGKSLGTAISEFKDAISGKDDEPKSGSGGSDPNKIEKKADNPSASDINKTEKVQTHG